MERLLIKKLHIDTLIQIFTELYENGVEYVDLYSDVPEEGEEEQEEDALGIHFSKEYMDPQYIDNFVDLEEDNLSNDDIKVTLSDDDINKLL